MRLSKIRRQHSLAFNMTPMIDIVFLLIIFFMTVSQITKTADHPVELPMVMEGGSKGPPTTITVNLNDRGEILVGGQRLSLEECVGAIGKMLKEKGADANQVSIQVRIDKSCESSFVNELVRRLSALGITQMNVAVIDP